MAQNTTTSLSPEEKRAIGKRIKLMRRAKGLKQHELAAMVGVSPAAISNYEQGTRVPKGLALRRLVAIFRCSPNYLLWGTTRRTRKYVDFAALVCEDGKPYTVEGLPNFSLTYDEVNILYRALSQAYSIVSR